MSDRVRRVAANEVAVEGKIFRQCVVELLDGRVKNYYTFVDELPFTEWLGGRIEIIDGAAWWNQKRLQ